MSQTYNDNIKKPKLQDTQLGILKTYQSTAGIAWYLSLRIHL